MSENLGGTFLSHMVGYNCMVHVCRVLD